MNRLTHRLVFVFVCLCFITKLSFAEYDQTYTNRSAYSERLTYTEKDIYPSGPVQTKQTTVVPGGSFKHGTNIWQVGLKHYETERFIVGIDSLRPNSSPSASISGPSSLRIGESGTIDFSASDSDGNLARWRFYKSTNSSPQWSSASGSSAGPGSYSVSGSGLGVGTHTFYVDAEDSSGASDSSSLTITVEPAYEPTYDLTVSAGAGGTASGSATGLSGTATRSISASPDGTHDFDRWSGDAVANSTSASTTISMGNQNRSVTALFKAKATGGSGDNGSSTPTKSNQSTVTITPTSKTITVGDSVSFTASGGSGTGAYVWSGASGSGTSVSKTFTSTGTFTVSVYRAGDSNYNQSNTATSTITVVNGSSDGGGDTGGGDTGGGTTKSNQSTVTITPASKTITVGDSVSFTAAGGSGTGAYVWNGATGSGASAARSFTSTGTFTVSVYRAGDSNYNDSNTATSTITVNAVPIPSGPLTVDIVLPAQIVRPKSVTSYQAVSFWATSSDGTVTEYQWSATTSSGASLGQAGWKPFKTTQKSVWHEGYYSDEYVSEGHYEASQVPVYNYIFMEFNPPRWNSINEEWATCGYETVLVGYKDGPQVWVDTSHYDAVWVDGYYSTETVPVQMAVGSVAKSLPITPTTALGTCTVTFTARDASGRTATLTRTTEIVQEQLKFTVTTATNPENLGTVTGAGTYDSGATVEVTAPTVPGFTFDRFTGALTGTTNPGSFTLTGNATVTANYLPNMYNVSVTVIPAGSGTVIGGGTYQFNQSCTLIPGASPGFYLGGFSSTPAGFAGPGATLTHPAPAVTGLVTQNVSVTATFMPQLPQNVTIGVPGVIVPGSEFQLTWESVEIPGNTPTSIVATGAATVTAGGFVQVQAVSPTPILTMSFPGNTFYLPATVSVPLNVGSGVAQLVVDNTATSTGTLSGGAATTLSTPEAKATIASTRAMLATRALPEKVPDKVTANASSTNHVPTYTANGVTYVWDATLKRWIVKK